MSELKEFVVEWHQHQGGRIWFEAVDEAAAKNLLKMLERGEIDEDQLPGFGKKDSYFELEYQNLQDSDNA